MLDVWIDGASNRQLFSVVPSLASGGAASGIVGVNLTIVNIGRTGEGCAATYASVASVSPSWCAVTSAGLGTASSPGAQRWALENVPGGGPNLVYISNQVCVPHCPVYICLAVRCECEPGGGTGYRSRRMCCRELCPLQRRPVALPPFHVSAGPHRGWLRHALPGGKPQLQRQRGRLVCARQRFGAAEVAADSHLMRVFPWRPNSAALVL